MRWVDISLANSLNLPTSVFYTVDMREYMKHLINLGMLVFAVFLCMFESWVFKVVWNWYAPSWNIFTITFVQSLGLRFVLLFLFHNKDNFTKEQQEDYIYLISYGLSGPTSILILAWIFHFFI